MRGPHLRERETRRRAALCACLLASLAVACSAASRYKLLSVFFDGVPRPPEQRQAATGPQVPNDAGAEGGAASFAHGPYANRQCDACHDRQAKNALVAPREELCFRCHDLRLDKAFVHGPLASGGCLVCHDPHNSKYRFLLVADSGDFCVRCHDAATVAAVPAHAGAVGECTACHDAHMSDRKYLLR